MPARSRPDILRCAAENGPPDPVIESYVNDDKVYFVCIAPNEAMVREQAMQGGFHANWVSEMNHHRPDDGGTSSPPERGSARPN